MPYQGGRYDIRCLAGGEMADAIKQQCLERP